MDNNNYLQMQKSYYNEDASHWSLQSRDPVVGSYDQHNAFSDYDEFLFPKDLDTQNLTALEYGCGPARNLIRFHNKFKQIDGVDIAEINLDKAIINLQNSGISNYLLYLTDGKSIPAEDSSYDVVFSVICLQHICVHDIRMKIMEDVYRVLKPGGHFCFQMGYGQRYNAPGRPYYDNYIDAVSTNGGCDTLVEDENYLISDLEKIGFKDVKVTIRPTGPGDSHDNWIWVQTHK